VQMFPAIGEDHAVIVTELGRSHECERGTQE
jgi:hypothetical protein